MQDRVKKLEEGLQTAFVCSDVYSDQEYRPQFLFNDEKAECRVLDTIKEELQNCEEFFISSAFITEGGISLLMETFRELEKKGVPGKILTTDYQGITEKKAIHNLAGLKNIELRVYKAKENKTGFHTKGYVFKRDGLYRMILGSSNMTKPALISNKEWNIKFVSTKQGEIVRKVKEEFDKMWNSIVYTISD
ncbi:MAG: hypothetical protein HFI37_03510 [Lachnospiraceae bacterium]|jgi:HKD family nuclease|nr:hypothetical protein [Lachnospiraceae bacterium]